MSHIPSPGPSALPHPQMFVQPSATPSARQKNKPFATGIAAGVEDEKYQAKYKELKRKVKEIEMDNDKLQFKVLMAKKSIQRMKLERAVLYERLSAVPPSPDLHGHAPLPPLHPGSAVPPQHSQQIPGSANHRDPRDMDVNDPNAVDYVLPSGNVCVISGPDGRPVQLSDGPIGPGVAPSHAVSAAHMSRRGSASGHDSRQLPPLSQLTPVQHLEHPRNHAHSHPHMSHLHSHSNGSDSRSRPHSSSHSRGQTQGPLQGYHPGGMPLPHQYPPESLPPAQGMQSPPLGHERERSRRHDAHERSSHSVDPYPHGRPQMAHASSLLSPTSARGLTTRVHNHQHVGPGTSINHPDFDHERDLERERNWLRQREHDYDREVPREYANSALIRNSPPPHLRLRPEREYQDHAYRLREDQLYLREPIGPGVYGRSSRSDTPRSGSGSASGHVGAGEAQPRSDTHSQYYDRERQRPYAPRGINQPQAPNEDIDFGHEDSRSHNRGGSYMPPEQHRPPLEPSRKRSRNDMDVDGENDSVSPAGDSSGGGGEGSSRYGGNHRADDRGPKRHHQEGMSTSAQGYGGHDEPGEGHSGD